MGVYLAIILWMQKQVKIPLRSKGQEMLHRSRPTSDHLKWLKSRLLDTLVNLVIPIANSDNPRVVPDEQSHLLSVDVVSHVVGNLVGQG